MRTQPRCLRRVLIRGDVLRRIAKARFGHRSGSQIAGYLGVDPTTMNRLLAGTGHPSSILIATILDTFDARFEDLFVTAPLVRPESIAA